jgi:glycine cleavage system aminomethyltransferase T
MSTLTPSSSTLYIGPWQRKSPFFGASLRYGAKAFDIYNHMLIPGFYDDPITEYWHLLNHVTLWDVAVERIVEITGPDALEFTNSITCRDLTKCDVGRCKYAPIIAPDGGIVNDPVLLRVEEDRFWLALADSDAGLYAIGVAAHAGLDVKISHPEIYPVQVQGPKAKDVLRDLVGAWILDVPYYGCAKAEIAGAPVVIGRTGWTGEIGYEVYLCDPSKGEELWEAIMEAGRPHDIRPIAPSEIRRLEAGIFNYGSDITLENTPFEATGMERLVEQQDADYVGKQALERVREQGVSRKLVGIDMGGTQLEHEITDMWPAFSGDDRVGHVTDLIWSPRLETNIGYVWLPIDMAAPGTAFDVEAPTGERIPAVTSALPFVDPKKEIPAA